MMQVERVVEHTQMLPQFFSGEFASEAEKLIERCEAVGDPLARLVMVGIQHDTDNQFSELWVHCLQRLLRADRRVDGTFQESVASLRRYPALLYVRVAGLGALLYERDELFVSLLTRPKWRPQFGNSSELTAAHALAEYDVLNGDLVNALPRSGGSKWLYPPSHHLRATVRPLFQDTLPGKDEYSQAQDDYEFYVALVQHVTASGYQQAVPGEFIGEWRWDGDTLIAEKRFRARAADAPDDWVWFRLAGGKDKVDELLASLGAHLKPMKRWG